MNNFYLLKTQRQWDGRPPRPIPKVTEGPFSQTEAEDKCRKANEAEGRATDGIRVSYTYQVIEGQSS